MILTKECDYAIRTLRALADHSKKTVEAICKQEHIPHKYAYKILKKLEKANFVRSVRGRDGGYQLAASLSSFTPYDVITAVDDRLLVFECLQPEAVCPNNQGDNPCRVHQTLQVMQDMMHQFLNAKTMQEFI